MRVPDLGGSSDKESAFLEATPSGNDVFFLTDSQLVAEDTDTAFDIYDARVCTEASPCLSQHHSELVPCEQVATCRPAQAPQQPPSGPSGSSTASGPASTSAGTAPGHETKATKTSAPKPLTRAQKLALMLKQCRKQHPHAKAKRRACEARAHRLYGPKPKRKATKRRGNKSAAAKPTDGHTSARRVG